MWGELFVVAGIFVFIWRWYFTTKLNLDHIPGHDGSMLWSIVTSQAPDIKTFHIYAAQQAGKYGPVMKLPQLGGDPFVFLNDFDSIYQAMVKQGRETGGRPQFFRWQSAMQGTGFLGNIKPDKRWKLLRRITHGHLKQFGDGVSTLEKDINHVAEKMFQEFEKKCGVPFDPFQTIQDTAAETMIYLATGQCLPSDHPIVVKMKQYDIAMLHYASPYTSAMILILDFFPWLRHFGWPGYKKLLSLRAIEQDVWKMLHSINGGVTECESISKVLMSHVPSKDVPNSIAYEISDTDAIMSTFIILFAGTSTTTSTFYGVMNLLAHHRHIQDKMFSEMKEVVGNQTVSFIDKAKMPYAQATILEILRYTSVVPLSVPHVAISDTKIKGYQIPQGTVLLPNLFNMHWDKEFWGNPKEFRPERFLDDAGEILPVDHPRRKHLMPFGAGLRVCLGEAMATVRMFLWVTTLVQRFRVKPADDNTKSKLDPENFIYNGTLTSSPYNIILEKRE